MKNSRPYSIKF